MRERIVRWQALEADSSRMIDACGCGRVTECRIIEALALGAATE